MNNLPFELYMYIIDFLFVNSKNNDLITLKNTSKFLNYVIYYDLNLKIRKINYRYKEIYENLGWFYTPLNINLFFM